MPWQPVSDLTNHGFIKENEHGGLTTREWNITGTG
jgi:hypothetical protein